MGHGYKGDTGHHHSITENLGSLQSEYKYNNGYFGDPGQGRLFVRNIIQDTTIPQSPTTNVFTARTFIQ